MAALRADPHGVLVDATTAGELSIESGDRVGSCSRSGRRARLARRSAWPACSRASPGFARRSDLVVGLGAYAAATTSRRIDFFLARTSDHSHAGLARAVAALARARAATDRRRDDGGGARQGSVESDGPRRTQPRRPRLALHAAHERRRDRDLHVRPDPAAPARVRRPARAGHARARSPLARARRGGARRLRRDPLRPARRRLLGLPARPGPAVAVHRAAVLRPAGERAGGPGACGRRRHVPVGGRAMLALRQVRPTEILREP